MEWGRGNDKPQDPPWAELGCLGGDGRAHAPPPWLCDVKHITCPLHPFLTVWRGKNRPWCMVLDQQGACPHGSSPMVSGARAPLGNCVNVLLFLQSCFFLTQRTHWSDLWFVHIVTSGDMRGLYLRSALSVKDGERRPRSQCPWGTGGRGSGQHT